MRMGDDFLKMRCIIITDFRGHNTSFFDLVKVIMVDGDAFLDLAARLNTTRGKKLSGRNLLIE
jgi:hypothetical protein